MDQDEPNISAVGIADRKYPAGAKNVVDDDRDPIAGGNLVAVRTRPGMIGRHHDHEIVLELPLRRRIGADPRGCAAEPDFVRDRRRARSGHERDEQRHALHSANSRE
jgi:hypothetical protein